MPTDSTREAIGFHSICLPFKLEPTCQLGFSLWKRVFCWWIPFFGVWQPRFKNPFRYRSWDFYLWNIPSMVWKWKIRKIHLAMGTFVNTFYSLIFFCEFSFADFVLIHWSGAGAFYYPSDSRFLRNFGPQIPNVTIVIFFQELFQTSFLWNELSRGGMMNVKTA